MLTLIKVKVKLQLTVNCGDEISTIPFKQKANRRENTSAVDTNSTPQQGENQGVEPSKANLLQQGGKHRPLSLSLPLYLSLYVF